MLLSVIIVNHNTGSTLRECVDSLYDIEKTIEKEIIIVDNHSNNSSYNIIESLAKKYKNIKKIYFQKLESFSYANNRGFDLSSGEYILILNPDIIFIEPVLSDLIKLLDDESTGAVCPALIGSDGKFQSIYFQRYPTVTQYILFYTIFAKIFLKIPWLINRYLENREINISSKKRYTVQQIPCAFFLTRRRIFQEIGMMDENFLLFFEDMDLSYRIAHKHKLIVDTSLKVKHIGGASFKPDQSWKMYGRFIMSMNYFFDEHYNPLRSFLLKYFSFTNSIVVLLGEYIKKIFGESDPVRIQKHKRFMKLFKEYYF